MNLFKMIMFIVGFSLFDVLLYDLFKYISSISGNDDNKFLKRYRNRKYTLVEFGSAVIVGLFLSIIFSLVGII